MWHRTKTDFYGAHVDTVFEETVEARRSGSIGLVHMY